MTSGEEPGATPPTPASSPAPSGGNRIIGPTEVGVTTGAGWTTATYQDPDEAAHKRQMEADDAAHMRKKEDEERAHSQKKELDEIRRQTFGQIVALALVVVVALGCLWVIVSNKYPSTTVDKAAGALLLIVGGFVGFITGQATKK